MGNKKKETLKEQTERLNSLSLNVDDCLELGLQAMVQLSVNSNEMELTLKGNIHMDGMLYKIEVDYKVFNITENLPY